MSPIYKSFINSPELGRTVDAAGTLIHYVDDGFGPPIVLLHGLGFSLFSYRKNIPHLIRNMRVLALDLPGCGYSTLPSGFEATPEAMARYLKAFLQGLNIEHAVICGAGEGGIYALELACRYPECVSGLVLVSPGSLTQHFPWYMKLLPNDWIGDKLVQFMGMQEMHRFLQWCYFSEISVDKYLVRQMFQPFEIKATRKSLLRLFREYDDRYVHENMGSIACPTYIIWGKDDPGRPSGMAQMYKDAIPGAHLSVLRNCGMLPHEEKPDEFNDYVARFAAFARPQEDFIGGDPFDEGLD